MNIQPMATKTYNLDTGGSAVNTYMPLEHIPSEFYKTIMDWVSANQSSLKNLYVSVSTDDGYIIVPTSVGSGVNLGGIGVVEIELRGALIDFDDIMFKHITLNSKFELVLHTTNGEFAFPLCITEEVRSTCVNNLFNTKVVKRLKKKFSKVEIKNNVVNVAKDRLSKPKEGLHVE